MNNFDAKDNVVVVKVLHQNTMVLPSGPFSQGLSGQGFTRFSETACGAGLVAR